MTNCDDHTVFVSKLAEVMSESHTDVVETLSGYDAVARKLR